MIGYEAYCQIRHLHGEKGLTFTQIAQELALDPETVAKYARQESFPRRGLGRRRASKLDSFKPMIIRLLERHPYSTTQLYDLLRQEGYEGGMSILKDYAHRQPEDRGVETSSRREGHLPSALSRLRRPLWL